MRVPPPIVCLALTVALAACSGKDQPAQDTGPRDGASVDQPTGADLRSPTGIGQSCAVSNTCPPTASTCLAPGGPDNAAAYCTAPCAKDTDCPSAFLCRETKDKRKLCHKRLFCFPCDTDGQCESGGRCVKQGTASFCTRPCHPGTTECPRIAECKDVGGGSYQCVHKAGTCVGEGKLCQPCLFDSDCQVGGPCWNYRYSGENFCGQDCSTQSCPATYSCGSDKQCELPGADPSCVKLSPTMEVGDTLDDFAMVGYVDTTHNNSLVDEAQSQQPKVVKLSDFASTAKVILFTGAAGWCTSCQKETGTFAQLMTTYGPQGLMIVQALFDTDTEFEPATVAFLKTWIGAFKPAGACGVDPGWDTVAWNTTSATPLNIIIEAKTRKILSKFYSATGVETEIKKALGM